MSASSRARTRTEWLDESWTERSFWDAVAWAIEQFGRGHDVFEFQAERLVWTLGDVQSEAAELASALIDRGFAAGDAIAVWAPGRSIWVRAELAAGFTGGIICGLNTRYRHDELVHVLGMVKPKFIFVTPDFLKIDSLALLRNTLEDLDDLARFECELVVCPLDPASRVEGQSTLDEFIASHRGTGDALLERAATVRAHDAVIAQFTSGSTGHPKGVVLTQDAAVRTAYHVASAVGLTHEDTMYSALPFYHIGGTICTGLAAVVSGTKMIIPEQWLPADVIDTLADDECTAFQGHAAMYSMILDELKRARRPLDRLRKGWVAAAPPPLMQRIHDELGIDGIIHTYGLSESGLTSACVPSDPWEKRRTTIGRPIPGAAVTIRDPNTGEELPDGVEGEICVKGPLVMREYLHEPESTASAFRDGWLRTADIGAFDEDGYLLFTGRIKDMIKPGGENVSAAEVERFLLDDSRIVQAVVVGIPDDRLGEVPAAVIQLAEGAAITGGEVIQRCREGIANFKVPRRVKLIDELPMLGSGKVDRRQIREVLLAEIADETSDGAPR